jgi:putative membrane protein
VRILIAFPFAVKHYLRAEWGTFAMSHAGSVIAESAMGVGSLDPEYRSLLPAGFEAREAEGLGVPLQLTFFVDSFIKRGQLRGWYDAPGASSMGNQLNALIDAYGKMETIKLTPIPIAHLYVPLPHSNIPTSTSS